MLSLSYILLQNSKVQTFIINKITTQLSKNSNANFSIGRVEFTFFNQLILDDVLISDQNNDTILYTAAITAKIDTLKIRKRHIALSKLAFDDNRIFIERDSANHFNFASVFNSSQKKSDTIQNNWKLTFNNLSFENTQLHYNDYSIPNERHVFVHQLDINISDFYNGDDSLQFKINSLSLNDGKNIYLEEFSANFKSTVKKTELASLNLKTRNSEINNLSISFSYPEKEKITSENMNFDFQLSNSTISFTEVAELFPKLRGMNENVECSGHIYGNIADLKGKDLTIKTGRKTNAVLDFYINDIEDPETMYLFLDLKKLQTTFSDIENFHFPISIGNKTC